MSKLFAMLSACLMLTQSVQAHFIFLAPQDAQDGKRRVEVYSGEDASLSDASFLKYTQGIKAWGVRTSGKVKELKVNRSDDSVSFSIPEKSADKTVVIATHDLGVMDRGDAKFRLKYYAKTGPALGANAWSKATATEQLLLNVIPEQTETGVLLHVLFDGKTVEGSEVVASGPELFDFKGNTGESGTVTLPIEQPGLYSIRAKHVEAEAGELDGKQYPETRHYTTLTLRVQSDLSHFAQGVLQPLEQPVTSFGGAILGNSVFIYGGHTGGAHSYSNEEQGRTLLQLNLKSGEWTPLAEGPPLQGLAMVPHGNRLYRIGGFTAKNAEGEDHDLWSQDSVAAFDLKQKKWIKMPALPEPRSSFDAAVLEDTIYVIGGWKLSDEGDELWHSTAWSMDLSTESPEWKALPEPPFMRRALAVAAHQGKIYAIGGMQAQGGPTTRVDIFDPVTQKWSEGPALVIPEQPQGTEEQERQPSRFSSGMTGFGASAFATGGHLHASTIDGDLQRLSKDGTQWKVIDQTPTARFFHRMLPLNSEQLIVVGGASMEVGKFEEVEVLNVQKK